MNEKTNYGNWVPEKALYLLFGLAAVFLTITVLLRGLVQIPVLTIIMGVVFVLTVIMAVYMLVCHETFAFGKGNMMAEVHRHLVEHLEWNGEGTLLDIGCGAAAPSGVRRLFQRRRSQQWITGVRSGITQKSSVKKMRGLRVFPIVSRFKKEMRQNLILQMKRLMQQ